MWMAPNSTPNSQKKTKSLKFMKACSYFATKGITWVLYDLNDEDLNTNAGLENHSAKMI